MSREILFREQDEKNFFIYWQTLLNQEKVGPRYLDLNLNYNLSISQGRKLFVKDKSFIYLLNNVPRAGIFFPIERKDNALAASILGNYIEGLLISDRSIEDKFFSVIDDIAQEQKLNKVMLSLNFDAKYNYLQKYDYLDTSILTYFIDLSFSGGDLLAKCRKGHRGDIKKILNNKDFKVFFVDRENPSYELHEEYRTLHHKCSGKVTRSKESFDLQFEKLKQGKAALFGLKYKQKNVCFNYFEFNHDKAVYASGADDPEFDKMPLYHALIFSAMEYLKKKGARYIDTGQPSSPSAQFDYYPDGKQLNIALFKRGFGGDFKQNLRGIKYFSKDAFKEDVKTFADRYKA